jgi:hypothetical protein
MVTEFYNGLARGHLILICWELWGARAEAMFEFTMYLKEEEERKFSMDLIFDRQGNV